MKLLKYFLQQIMFRNVLFQGQYRGRFRGLFQNRFQNRFRNKCHEQIGSFSHSCLQSPKGRTQDIKVSDQQRKNFQIKTVALTFDDGPHPENTPAILKLLKLYDFKATFFLQGNLLRKYHQLGRMIVEQGHEIGNHTYEHIDIKKCSYNKFHDSVLKTEKLISSIYKKHNKKYRKLIRTPYGSINFKLLYYILRHKYLLVSWNKDSRDSFIRNDKDLIKYFQSYEIYDGDIILFHEDYNHTVKALPEILYSLNEQGVRSVPVSFLSTTRFLAGI